ncbi:ABC transporter ATP-binding protein [Vulcanimicrobium alpinum]|uniref:ABC transporter ATP-binding protein n=1 Tax=Vulcanimicrobium alpinum TaxID=3016050 RepID=A0AAN1XVJ5_UNVUL|nr:ABC transporter ATP-binding protein [Vulcanimicrobium alpinum]BDE05092.1 ABC transporter ATP-binding protein [Vulcanimicrobium alpinum]
MIAIRGLTKRYRDVLAVDEVSLEVPSGSVCGLLGRNGAGKTTTFKCLLGFAQPERGEVRFNGVPRTPATFASLGYVPERPAHYGWLTVAQHLEFARRTQPSYDAAFASELLATFRLDPRKKSSRLSKGQQTALSLILALAHRPQILILDEPASGLDPLMQRVVLDLLIDAGTSGATILLSSHQIGQIDRAADRVAIMRDGKIVLAGVLDDLREAARIVEATFIGSVPDLGGLERTMRVEQIGTSIRVHANSDAAAVTARLGALGAAGVRVVDRSLEDVFLDAVGDGEGAV